MTRHRRGRRTLAVAGVATAAAATLTALALSNRGVPRPAAQAPLPNVAQVTRQTLVDRQVESGVVGYGVARTVATRSGGTVTGLPGTGTTIRRGQALFRVDNAPVVLLHGTLPAYRDLTPGTSGVDVRQLENNLRALGYKGFTVDDDYSGSTAAAVRHWQEDLGLPETGTVELGRVHFARGDVRVDSHDAEVGAVAQPGASVISYTGTARVVVVELKFSEQRLARKGGEVSLTMADGKQIAGKVGNVELVVQPADGQKPASTVLEVTIKAEDPRAMAGLDRSTVDVGFVAARRENVLTVPVAALLALAEGGYGVEVVDGMSRRVAAVETGLFADGRVEIEGDGVVEGTTVGMPS